MKKQNIIYWIIGIILVILLVSSLIYGFNKNSFTSTGKVIAPYGENKKSDFEKCFDGCVATYPNPEPDDTEANACYDNCFNYLTFEVNQEQEEQTQNENDPSTQWESCRTGCRDTYPGAGSEDTELNACYESCDSSVKEDVQEFIDSLEIPADSEEAEQIQEPEEENLGFFNSVIEGIGNFFSNLFN